MKTTTEALQGYLVENGLAGSGDGPKDWYTGNWFHTRIFGLNIPFYPRFGYRTGLLAHDIHHMLNRYPTTWAGECETAARELASGGCGYYLVYWIDCVFFLLIAPIIASLRSVRAWRLGWGQHNCYRLDPEQLLAMDIAAVQCYLSL